MQFKNYKIMVVLLFMAACSKVPEPHLRQNRAWRAKA